LLGKQAFADGFPFLYGRIRESLQIPQWFFEECDLPCRDNASHAKEDASGECCISVYPKDLQTADDMERKANASAFGSQLIRFDQLSSNLVAIESEVFNTFQGVLVLKGHCPSLAHIGSYAFLLAANNGNSVWLRGLALLESIDTNAFTGFQGSLKLALGADGGRVPVAPGSNQTAIIKPSFLDTLYGFGEASLLEITLGLWGAGCEALPTQDKQDLSSSVRDFLDVNYVTSQNEVTGSSGRYSVDLCNFSSRTKVTTSTTGTSTIVNATTTSEVGSKMGGTGAIIATLCAIGAAVCLTVYLHRRHSSKRGKGANAEHNLRAAAIANEIGMQANPLRRVLKHGRGNSGGTQRTYAMIAEMSHIVKTKAKAEFLTNYRQLVSATSMDEYEESIKLIEVPRESLQVLLSGAGSLDDSDGGASELGRGQSGVVFRGCFRAKTAKSTREISNSMIAETLSPTSSDVAIKTCVVTDDNGGINAVGNIALLVEALLLNGLRHPAIISLVAVVTDSVPVMLVTELMVNGDLRKLLRACRPHKVEKRVTVVTEANMATMAAKMASAMAFLERRSILHRDLAARNILVGALPSDVKLAVSDESHLVYPSGRHPF
jgi:hypothetical protein